MYPLGSCTMKYNARVNEVVARLEGLAKAHPYQPEKLSQGALRIMKTLADALLEITGMDAITLQPAAGAHGEMTGILMVRAYLQSKGNPRKKILIPDSAHGTNPATAAMCGYAVENLKSNAHGMVDVRVAGRADERRRRRADADQSQHAGGLRAGDPQDRRHPARQGRAALHGWREHERAGGQGAARRFWRGRHAPEPAQDFFHAARRRRAGIGAGGRARRFWSRSCRRRWWCENADGTLGFDYDRPQSIGRVRMFYGNFGMHVRALAYIMANGPDGLRQTTEDAVLNANYIRKKLEGVYDLPYKTPTMHEVVFSDRIQERKGVKTGDIAKRLIDYGFHPYTTSFPLVVPGALMIEPTESESKEELDLFIEAMKSVAEEAENSPEVIAGAPHRTRVSRMDETAAARKPVLRWRPKD